MIYHNTSLTGSLQSPNAARKQGFFLYSEELRNINKHEHLPMNDFHVGHNVMFQDATSKWQYPATITICVLNQEVTTPLHEMVILTEGHKHM